MKTQPTYPRAFITPGGRTVSIRTMANAMREIRKMPPTQDVFGWDWCPCWAIHIRSEVRRGIHDRINRR